MDPQSANKSAPDVSHVAAVALKLPPYWPNDPAVWFAQVQAQFMTRGITSEQTQFAYIVSALQPEIAQEVRDILMNPPTDTPYSHLKAELIRRTSVSEQKRLHQLLTQEELGDRKPSQLLRRMEQLLGSDKLDETIFKQLFLQRLPHHVQTILASSRDDMKVTQLADLADRIIDVGSTSTVSAVSTPSSPAPSCACSSDLSQLRQQVDRLTFQVQSLTTHFRREGGRSPNRRPFRSDRQRSRSSSEKRPFCWYHWKHGAGALKCTPPCNFKQSSSFSSDSQQSYATNAQGNDRASRE
ncbi:hypothetical protein BSL78_01326 [Apostichopus japonicus]|uniref:DUF7041 domain-containing protein n=1 Tax=Stichopus japonicus TaxID=307972 RepID=A0A2G8LNJ3_STIJA|nr:hypothetical protein BSL78_01326 [Apostichopus japonicus]